MYSLFELLLGHACDNLTERSLMPKRYLFAAQFRYTLTPTLIHTKCIAIQPSVMGYIANSVSLVKRKARSISSVRHCVSTLSFYSRWFSPDQGMYSVHWDLLAPQLSTLHRLSSYVWPEIMTTRYRALTISSLRCTWNRFSMWFRHVNKTRLPGEYHY